MTSLWLFISVQKLLRKLYIWSHAFYAIWILYQFGCSLNTLGLIATLFCLVLDVQSKSSMTSPSPTTQSCVWISRSHLCFNGQQGHLKPSGRGFQPSCLKLFLLVTLKPGEEKIESTKISLNLTSMSTNKRLNLNKHSRTTLRPNPIRKGQLQGKEDLNRKVTGSKLGAKVFSLKWNLR